MYRSDSSGSTLVLLPALRVRECTDVAWGDEIWPDAAAALAADRFCVVVCTDT